MKKAIIIAAIALVFVAGCSKDDGTSDDGTHNWFPVAVGNQWGYNVTRYSLDDDSIDTTYEDVQTLDHTSVLVADGLTYTVLIDSDGDSTYFRKGDTYLWAAYFYDYVVAKVKAAELDLQVGDFWGTDTSLGVINLSTSGECIAKETVTVPKGTFPNCCKIQLITTVSGMTSSCDTTYFWLADGVGPIKYESNNVAENYREVDELYDYTIVE